MSMDLAITDDIRFTEFRRSDVAALVEGLNDREIYERTSRVPFPYTPPDAEKWLDLLEADQGALWPLAGAIRDRHERLIGSVGLERKSRPDAPICEMGYWLAKPYWGRGIMTSVGRAVCRHTFETLDLLTIAAHVFSFNDASARVLEKCGFQFEAYLTGYVRKDGRSIDAKLFSLAAPPRSSDRSTDPQCPPTADDP
jgi:ribosomal-protein-alanine N-acetyltransferase